MIAVGHITIGCRHINKIKNTALSGPGVLSLKKKIFIKNAFIMTATALILRTIGIFFRIYMSNKIGAEGMGLYQLIFSVYMLGSTFASAGICTAVTRLVTDELVCGTKSRCEAFYAKRWDSACSSA